MTTTVGVVCEGGEGERRVALTPDGVSRLQRLGLAVLVEAGAGTSAWFPDTAYAAAGARLVSRDDLYLEADVVLCVHPPSDASRLHEGQTLIGLLQPLYDPGFAAAMAEAKVTAVSLDLLPRTLSRAQSMDVLTSQANVAGYKAVLVAANTFGGYFPMLMTAAGTTRPAQVFVIGAGVAGLQAIATARRLGAVVTAYDVRDAARADIVSTGAALLEFGSPVSTAETGGYARPLNTAELDALRQAMDTVVTRFDVVITTAQVAGGRPPLMIGHRGLSGMKPGSVVVDLAAGPLGGNVETSTPDAVTVTGNGVTVIGAGNLAAQVPTAASTAYSRNMTALLDHLTRGGELAIDLADEVQAGIVVAHAGEIIHPQVRAALAGTQERV
ncbi:MAG TPA: NAD(P) transhydrogenase subunit alpha [Candidatus Limnocylindrales bacterium]|nr:NAD(P) transhydrogenase subunit alpha [Candidatus Limnocylindrales bacterium]